MKSCDPCAARADGQVKGLRSVLQIDGARHQRKTDGARHR